MNSINIPTDDFSAPEEPVVLDDSIKDDELFRDKQNLVIEQIGDVIFTNHGSLDY